jgi:methyl-accepting chemotaxis protein
MAGAESARAAIGRSQASANFIHGKAGMLTLLKRTSGKPASLPENEEPEPLARSREPLCDEIARHVPLLQVLKNQVEGAARQVEESVIAVCSTFQQIADQARAGVSRASGFLSGTSGRSRSGASVEDLIGRTRTTFDSVLNTLAHSSELSRQAVERMREVDRQAEQIAGTLKLLDGIATGNRILALNARIEAAHAGAYGKGFEVVAAEVIRQADESHGAIAGVTETIQSLRATASSALADLTRMSDQGMASVEAERQQVERTLQSFNDLDQEMRALLRDSSEDSARLSEEISRAVTGMQFQDRVNQRLHHVAEALDDSRERFSGLCGGADAADEGLIDEIMARYTMHEERTTAHRHENEAGAGEVELF